MTGRRYNDKEMAAIFRAAAEGPEVGRQGSATEVLCYGTAVVIQAS